jgi:DsbC/DsbD-like thiol-disulfide interchange protein
MRSWLATLFVCLASFAPVAAAQPDEHPAKVELLANVSSIQPGDPFRVGVRFTMRPHWHVYWLNPGDSGLPPQVKWKLPEGFTVSELQFPVPKKFEQPGDMVGYGYEDEVLLTATVTPPKDLKQGTTVPIAADVSWMVCQDICLLGDASLSLELPTSAVATPNNLQLFKTWADRLPTPPEKVGARPSSTAEKRGGETYFIIEWTDRAPGKVEWYPPASDAITFSDIRADSEGKRTMVLYRTKLLAGKTAPRALPPSLLAYDAGNGARRGILVPVPVPQPAGNE